MGASAIPQSVDFRAFAVSVKTIAPTQKLYQSGHAIWWYDLPMPVWTFLEEYDLFGKTVVPFFSHNGSSNGANSLDRVSELAKDAEVLTGQALSLRGSSVKNSEKEVKDWAAGFGK